MGRTRRYSALVMLMAVACGGRSLSTEEAGADVVYPAKDSALVLDGSPVRDGPRPDADNCGCSAEQVWLRGPCMPTSSLGCGQACDLDDPARACPTGMRCEGDAAARCCHCSVLVAACVPDLPQEPLQGGLRISPTVGVAGEDVRLRIEGHDFVVGPFFYSVRVGGEIATQDTGPQCTLHVRFRSPAPGTYPVEVSQYGGAGPSVLAGFYHATAGVLPPPSIQPDHPCVAEPAPGDASCASGGSYACECVDGRCACRRL